MNKRAILPRPSDSVAQVHSDRLRAVIDDAIANAGGWLEFPRFMSLLLYMPGLGYYDAGAAKFGAAGDFVTAPQMTPLFGYTLARWVIDRWDTLCLATGEILELGAGNGILARDLVTCLERQGRLPDRYWILEVSADLRERQRQTLLSLGPGVFDRVAWIDRLPERFRGVVLANEVLDALPVHRVRWDGESWQQLGVTSLDGRWQWSARPIGADSPLGGRLPEGRPLAVPYDTEVGLEAEALVATLGDCVEEGAACFLDYGFPAREFYHPQRHGGTLMCHHRHHAHPDPFLYPGLQDVTAHVDFTAVAAAGRRAGWGLVDYATQAEWLVDWGILDELRSLGEPASVDAIRATAAVQRLLSPAEMGEFFKVLVLEKNRADDPAALMRLGLC